MKGLVIPDYFLNTLVLIVQMPFLYKSIGANNVILQLEQYIILLRPILFAIHHPYLLLGTASRIIIN